MICADPTKCSGCARCEMACSFGKTKAYSHSGSVIRLARDEEAGLDFPVTCVQCYRCVAACHMGALSITDKGLIKLDREKCNPRTWAKPPSGSSSGGAYCGLCAEACPVGIIEFTETPVFCNECGRCVSSCNLGALVKMEKPAIPELPGIGDMESVSPAMRRALWAQKHAEKLPWLGDGK